MPGNRSKHMKSRWGPPMPDTEDKMRDAKRAIRTNIEIADAGTVWRHVETGGHYIIIAHALVEADLSPVIVYGRLDEAGQRDGLPLLTIPDDRTEVWSRPAKEFLDGRFEQIGVGF